MRRPEGIESLVENGAGTFRIDGLAVRILLKDRLRLLDLRGERRRKLAYGGYANWHYARTDEIAYVGSNRGRGRRLYDLARDPREERSLAHRPPKRIDALYGTVVRRAGGRLPIYR